MPHKSKAQASSKTRSHEVAAVLRTEILRHQYRPGERLPSERDLAGRFETSRGVVREALKQLEQLGIIDIQLGGVRVLPREEATLEILTHLMELEGPSPKLADDYLQVFKMINAMSAERAIAIADDAQLAFMEDQIAMMRADPVNKQLMREGWTALSTCFLTLADNLVVRLIVNGLKGQLLVALTAVNPELNIDQKRMNKILSGMAGAVKGRDAKSMGVFVGQYFDWVREITATSFANAHAANNSSADRQPTTAAGS